MAHSIHDVAKKAGVSIATVSRVLTNKPYVRQQVRDQVLAAAKELNYEPDRVARSFRTQKSNIIGLIISDIENPHFTSVVRAVEDIARANQYSVVLCNTDESSLKESQYIDLMISEKAVGVVITPTQEKNNAIKKLVEANIPVVCLDRRMRDLSLDTVLTDNVESTCRLIQHLIDQGFKEIAAVVGNNRITTGRERYQGYIKALQENNLPVKNEFVRTCVPQVEFGFNITKELLGLQPRPDVIFAGNNLLTMGAYQAIREAGLRIPHEIGLVGFDDMTWTSMVNPAITVIAQPIYDLGKTAAELLVKRIKEPQGAIQEIIIKSRLEIRGSSMRIQS